MFSWASFRVLLVAGADSHTRTGVTVQASAVQLGSRLNGTEPLSMFLITPVGFLWWRIRMPSVRRVDLWYRSEDWAAFYCHTLDLFTCFFSVMLQRFDSTVWKSTAPWLSQMSDDALGYSYMIPFISFPKALTFDLFPPPYKSFVDGDVASASPLHSQRHPGLRVLSALISGVCSQV